MTNETKILISRFLTRSGDQAWDFAVPIVLISMFPHSPRIAFGYFFLIRLGSVLLMPYTGQLIDQMKRKDAMRAGIGLQLMAVIGTGLTIFFMAKSPMTDFNFQSTITLHFVILLLMGLLSMLGSSMMDISVAQDLVPLTTPPERLPRLNSQLRQLDLFTEVASPIAAGALLLFSHSQIPHFGFYLIVLWNALTFYPEYLLLESVLTQHPSFNESKPKKVSSQKNIFRNLFTGWITFIRHPIAIVIIANALLWISVLSPHGVLLTAFLSSSWTIPAPMLGLFRAGGAIFGLLATIVYPIIHRRLGLFKTTRALIIFQASMVALAAFCFVQEGYPAQICFLGFILLSRIGLYGFGLGETEIRQLSINENQRGEINGVATSLTSLATLIIFGLGIAFASPSSFVYLIIISSIAVALSALLLSRYISHELQTRPKGVL